MIRRLNGVTLLVEGFLMTIALSIVLGAFAYEGKQQLVAWVIGIPTITLLVVLIIAETVPSLLRYTRALGVSEDDAPDAGDSDGPPAMEAGTWRRVGIVYGWLAIYFVAIFAFGFYIATPVFLVAFLTWESKLTLYYASGVMAVALVPLYIIFRLILDIPLWPGVFPTMKVIPGIIGGGSIPQLN